MGAPTPQLPWDGAHGASPCSGAATFIPLLCITPLIPPAPGDAPAPHCTPCAPCTLLCTLARPHTLSRLLFFAVPMATPPRHNRSPTGNKSCFSSPPPLLHSSLPPTPYFDFHLDHNPPVAMAALAALYVPALAEKASLPLFPFPKWVCSLNPSFLPSPRSSEPGIQPGTRTWRHRLRHVQRHADGTSEVGG